MQIKYQSIDHFLFDSPFECVAHEFVQFPDILDKFNDVMDEVPGGEQIHWGGIRVHNLTEEPFMGGAFAGDSRHFNDKIYQAGFTYYHWAVWFYSLPKDMKTDDSIGYQLVLEEVPQKEAKIKAMALMRSLYSLDYQSVSSIFSQTGTVLRREFFSNIHRLTSLQTQMLEVGVKTEIIKPAKRVVKVEDIKFPLPPA